MQAPAPHADDRPPLDARAAGDARGDGAPLKFFYPSGSQPLTGYTIKRGVGRGGFGEVYFATSDAGKEVALKLIRRNLDVELRGVRHCLNLKHPNLVGLYDIRTDDLGDQWVVMEYVAGESLEDAIRRRPEGMPIEEAMRWMRGVCAGVAHLHDNGIVHRDLKPGNVFLDTGTQDDGSGLGGVVKIGDYGLSKFISCSRRSGQTESVGTVHYMAPEIANGRYGREIDTYALGVMLYEMLTGHVPFEGESIGEVLMKHLTAEADLSAIDPSLREVVRRSLAKDPEARIGSVGELMGLLPLGSPAAGGGAAPAHRAAAAPNTPTGPVFTAAATTPAVGPAAVTRAYAPAQGPGDSEPLYAALVETSTALHQSWRSATPWSPAARVLLGGPLAVAAVALAWLYFPLLLMALALYSVYYCVWAIFIRPTVRARLPEPAPAASLAATAPYRDPKPRVRRRDGWKARARALLAAETPRQRATNLLAAMLGAAALCIVTSLLVSLVIGNRPGASYEGLALWLAIVSTLGCWAVQVTNALTEGRAEDHAPMRAMMFALGASIGLASYGLSGLTAGLPGWENVGPRSHETFSHQVLSIPADGEVQALSGGVTVGVSASVGYFALLFLMLRWWRLGEYLRPKRLALMPVVGCVFAAWLLHVVWWYPQPAGMAVAGVVAVSTQLACRWLPPSRRLELADEITV